MPLADFTLQDAPFPTQDGETSKFAVDDKVIELELLCIVTRIAKATDEMDEKEIEDVGDERRFAAG